MNATTMPLLLKDWAYAEFQVDITPPPPVPVPERPTQIPLEFPDPHAPIGEPPPLENPIPVREPPATLPAQS